MAKTFLIYLFFALIISFASCRTVEKIETIDEKVKVTFKSENVSGGATGFVCKRTVFEIETVNDKIKLEFHVIAVDREKRTVKVTVYCADGSSHDITVNLNGGAVDTGCKTVNGKAITVEVN